MLYTVVWVWLALDPPSLSGSGDEPATAWAILLAILAGHVLLGYLVGEWWVLWVALVPVAAALVVAEAAQWIPLIGMAYAIPAASLLGYRCGHRAVPAVPTYDRPPKVTLGVATMCIGVGQGLAAVIENPAA